MMASPDVWPAMATAYETASGRLPARLLDHPLDELAGLLNGVEIDEFLAP
jgi:hypothetical protein